MEAIKNLKMIEQKKIETVSDFRKKSQKSKSELDIQDEVD
jgi:hypothetical protein